MRTIFRGGRLLLPDGEILGWDVGAEGARVVGVHIEGSHFAEARLGAHRSEYLRPPTSADADFLCGYRDVVTHGTVAPELPGPNAFLATLSRAGIRVSGGHSDAWEEDCDRALAAGMRQVTHLFNCKSKSRRRSRFRVAGMQRSHWTRNENF